MKVISAIILVVLSFANACGQSNSRIDSLESLLTGTQDTVEYELLTEIVREYSNVIYNYSIAFSNVKLAYQIAFTLCDTARIVRSSRAMGQLLNRLSRPKEAEMVFSSILPIAKVPSFKLQYGLILNSLGVSYIMQAKYDRALDIHFRCLQVRKTDNDHSGMSVSLNNIGLVYYKLKNYDKAIIYYQKCLNLKLKIADNYDLDRILINLALCYINKNDGVKADKYLKWALRSCEGKCTPNILIEANFAKGLMYSFALNDYEKSIAAFMESYQLSSEVGNTRYQIENTELLAEIFIKQEKFIAAKAYLKHAEILSLGRGYNELQANIYKQLSVVYEKEMDYKKAKTYQAKYIHLHDSIYSQQLTQNLMIAEVEFEQRANTAKLASQNKILALKEQVISRQRKINYLAGGASFLLLVLVSLLYFNNNQSKKANALLEQRVKERTQALEDSYSTIQKAFTEQSLVVYRATNDIKEPLTSLQGLCNIAIREVQASPTKQYVVQIENTVGGLADTILKISVRNG